MRKNKVLSVMGIFFSSLAFVVSVIELVFCLIHKMGGIIIMPLLLIIVMGAILAANIINMMRINQQRKRIKKGE